MTEPYRKKLIEVALPLAAINAESAREKSIRHGHPSTLHLWWARRPLAACRAVLFSSLVDDPDSDPQYRKPDGSVDEEAAGIKRADLFNLIEELVMWENSNNADVIRTARAEIARCVASRLIQTGVLKKETVIGEKTTAYQLVTRGHCRPQPMGLDTKVGRVRFSFDVSGLPPADVVNAFLAEHAPPVLDPFAGGGSIPLEAQRLGLRAYASDLNPVPVLINKALIEIPPKFAGRPPVNPESRANGAATKGKGKKSKKLVEHDWPGATGLAEDVRYYGQWMRDEAEKRIGHLYPKVEVTPEMAKDRPDLLPYVGQQLTVIAWLWARTVKCQNPACSTMTPLIASFVLCSKPGSEKFLKPHIEGTSVSFKIVDTASAETDPKTGFKRGTSGVFECAFCGTVTSRDYVAAEGDARRLGRTPTAIVAQAGKQRTYLPATIDLIPSVDVLKLDTSDLEMELAPNPRDVWCRNFGLKRPVDLFTDRQLLLLTTLSDLVAKTRVSVAGDACKLIDDADAYSGAVATYLGMAVSKLADYNSAMVVWSPGRSQAKSTFARQALPMVWDWVEVNPFADAAGDMAITLRGMCQVLSTFSLRSICGVVEQRDAANDPGTQNACFATDPPYYDNIAYADLSDFFYVWLRRSLRTVYAELLSTVLVPKADELVAKSYRFNGDTSQSRLFFEVGLGHAFENIRKHQVLDAPFTVFYAFKQSESDDDDDEDATDSDANSSRTSTGWETMLEGLIRSRFSVTGTWPMRSERGSRSVAIGTNALASSIVLVCRPRPDSASLATRKEFITTLRRELPEALRNLQRGNIAPVDLAQAAIGPGMAVFTRYAKVLESDGSPMTVRTALGLINQSLDEVLAEQEGEFDGDTRWALAWFEQFGMDDGPFGDAETLSKAKNTAVNGLEEAGIITARAGKVRLVKRDELPLDWNPATDKRLTVWEVTQHLIHRLDQKGETGAAELVGQLGGIAEISRDLAYRLYSTCERKKWAQEALAYNSLVVAWPELTKLARSTRTRQTSTQQELFN